MLGRRVSNIYRLGIKELFSLRRDMVLIALIVWAFSFAIYNSATGFSHDLRRGSIAIADQDGSAQGYRKAVNQDRQADVIAAGNAAGNGKQSHPDHQIAGHDFRPVELPVENIAIQHPDPHVEHERGEQDHDDGVNHPVQRC